MLPIRRSYGDDGQVRRRFVSDSDLPYPKFNSLVLVVIKTNVLSLFRTLLHESKKMYGRLGLIGNFARGGEARSSWRVGQVLKDQGKIDEANKNDQDARDTLRGLGKECPAELQEDNFNILLNYVDS